MEGPGIADFDPDLFPCVRIHAVMEGDLQNFREVQVTGDDVAFLSERASFHAAAYARGAGVLQGLSLTKHFHNHSIEIEKGRLPKSRRHHLQGPVEEPIRGFVADEDRGVGLKRAHLIEHL